MLWVLPLEPLEERYTKQWYNWFKDCCDKNEIEYRYIDGESLTATVEVGKVLDASGTIHWKASQLMRVSNLFKVGMIHDGDKFFTFDGQFPGIEAIRYMAQLYGISIEVYSYFHASSYTKEDFTVPMTSWLEKFELAWFNYYDKIFVGTNYHMLSILKHRYAYSCGDLFNLSDIPPEIVNKFVVTGTMYKSIDVLSEGDVYKYSSPTVIWPHRFDIEKRPDELLRLAEKHSDWNFVVTTSRAKLTTDPKCVRIENKLHTLRNVKIHEGISKEEYYNIMSKCHVFLSTSIEENFGICLLEAMTLGLMPVVRSGMSHSELVGHDERCLFDSFEDMESKIEAAFDEPFTLPQEEWTYYDFSMDRMLKEMEVITDYENPTKSK